MNLRKLIPSAPAPPDAAFFRAVLKLPRPSPEYVAAEIASRKASADLHALAGRREALKIESEVDSPGRTKLPTAALHATLKSLSEQISEAQVRERETRGDLDRLRAVYREEASAALDGNIEQLGAAVVTRLQEILELIDIAANLAREAREARVELLPGIVSDAPIARRLLEPLIQTFTRMMKGTRR